MFNLYKESFYHIKKVWLDYLALMFIWSFCVFSTIFNYNINIYSNVFLEFITILSLMILYGINKTYSIKNSFLILKDTKVLKNYFIYSSMQATLYTPIVYLFGLETKEMEAIFHFDLFIPLIIIKLALLFALWAVPVFIYEGFDVKTAIKESINSAKKGAFLIIPFIIVDFTYKILMAAIGLSNYNGISLLFIVFIFVTMLFMGLYSKILIKIQSTT